MSRERDIIEGAVAEWSECADDQWFTVDELLAAGIDRHAAPFIVASDPEHVALMETLYEAYGAAALAVDTPRQRETHDAWKALTAYRKEARRG